MTPPHEPRIVTCDNPACDYVGLRTVVRPIKLSERAVFDPSNTCALICASCGWLLHVLGPDESPLDGTEDTIGPDLPSGTS